MLVINSFAERMPAQNEVGVPELLCSSHTFSPEGNDCDVAAFVDINVTCAVLVCEDTASSDAASR